MRLGGVLLGLLALLLAPSCKANAPGGQASVGAGQGTPPAQDGVRATADAAPANGVATAPAAPTAPRVDPALSTGVVPLGDISLQLELGPWTVEKINTLLADAHQRFADPNARLEFVMERFRRTPFEYESQLELPAKNTLRVRLQSFGCTGFVIYMVALASARTFEEFTANLRRIRYLHPETGVDSDPEKGNILDFAYDIFIDSALAHGYVKDVTAEVTRGLPLTTFRTRWTARRRTSEYDTSKRLIVPKLHNDEVVAAQMISRATFKRMDRSAIKTGDVLLFSRVDPAKPVGDTLMVGHLAIAVNSGGEIYMMHATRDYAWRPDATKDSESIAAGVYYLDDPRREQLGVSNAGEWVADPAGRQVKIGGKPYYGYNAEKLRPVHDYIVGAHIQGLMVLRPVDAAAPAPRATAAAPSAQQADEPAIIDSKMTVEEAIKAHLAPDCPAAIAARQRVVDVSYTSLDGKLHKGQIVVDERVEADVREVFALIRDTKFPVRSVIPISDPAFLKDGRWDDDKSTAANNTSAFNYRAMTGSKKLSMHACGLALDLNPALNPYIKGKTVLPPGAVYDPATPGTLTADHPITRKLKALGWRWGGDFRSVKDYQHFEKLACP